MLTHLKKPGPPGEKSLFKTTDLCILDPCAGEGEALQILAEGLQIKPQNVFAVELHGGRAEKIRERLPEANVLGPCSFFGAEISTARFSLIYCNGPFDYAADGSGTREEREFIKRSYDLLAPKGVMILVCPHAVFVGQDFAAMFDSMFDQVEVYKFPDAARPYNEVCVFGRKRSDQVDMYSLRYTDDTLTKRGLAGYEARQIAVASLPALGDHQVVWHRTAAHWPEYKAEWVHVASKRLVDQWTLPYSWPPRKFAKGKLTDEERIAELKASPLWDQLREPEPAPLPRPWMQPQKGHTIMLMVSGLLDGLVPADPPHVARGHYLKKEKIDKAKCKSTVNEDTGAVTTVTHYSEEPVSLVRAIEVDPFGEPHLYEFRSDANEGEGDDDDSYDEEDD